MSTAAPIDPGLFATRFIDAGLAAGFRREPYGEVAGHPLFALTRRTSGPVPRIYLSSGVHGDEPAPVEALLRLIEEGCFDNRATWFLCPLVNPTGLALGTRANAGGVDLNRDYREPATIETQSHLAWLQRQPRFDLGLCLHEDWESTGFYLFEHNRGKRPSLAHLMLAAAANAGCPTDLGSQIDGHTASGGVIASDPDPWPRPLWPEAFYLRAFHSDFLYTLETPSAFPLNQRVESQVAAVRAALDAFCRGA